MASKVKGKKPAIQQEEELCSKFSSKITIKKESKQPVKNKEIAIDVRREKIIKEQMDRYSKFEL